MPTYDHPMYETIMLPDVDLSVVQNKTIQLPSGWNARIEKVLLSPSTAQVDTNNTTLLFGTSSDTDAYGTLLCANTATNETQVSTAFGPANDFADIGPTSDLYFSIAAATGNGDTGVSDIYITLAMWKSAAN